jgi:hypothetical protein
MATEAGVREDGANVAVETDLGAGQGEEGEEDGEGAHGCCSYYELAGVRLEANG